MAELTFAEISKLLKYDPETGRLFWLIRPREAFSRKCTFSKWNNAHAGKEAFLHVSSTGYLTARIRGRHYGAHRIAWVLSSGAWPENQIDHINGVRSDNRLANLRPADHGENSKNRCLSSRNTSGTIGVCWCNTHKRWIANITVNRKRKALGYFKEIEKAKEARRAAEIKYGFHENHGREQALYNRHARPRC